MKTGNYSYSRHIYYLTLDTFKTFKQYSLAIVIKGEKILPDIIRIESDQKKHKGKGFNKWLRIIDNEIKYKSTLVTGLRPTVKQNVFEGNKRKVLDNKIKPECLILIQYSNDYKTAVIDFFNGFYPYNPIALKQTILNHKYYLKDIKKREN